MKKQTTKHNVVNVVILAFMLIIISLIAFIRPNTAHAQSYNTEPLYNTGAGLTLQGYQLDNLIPFREFAISQGYVFDDDSTFHEFAENFDDLYYQAMEQGFIRQNFLFFTFNNVLS